jgi:Fe-S cluster assembly protein SufD
MIFLQTEPHASVQFHHRLIVEDNADVTLIEEYISAVPYSAQVVTTIEASCGACIHFYKIQDEHCASSHAAAVNVEQRQDSYFECFTLSKGAKTSQEQRKVDLVAPGAECRLWGLYTLTQDDQQMGHELQVNHSANHGTSHMFYKGILDKKSRAAFSGKVHVHPGVTRTSVSQTNHNVLLSTQAEIRTEPQLEIYADDLKKCTHGVTVGQLDERALFYLRSRGIDPQDAKKILLDAFMHDVIHAIPQDSIRRYIHDRFVEHAAL